MPHLLRSLRFWIGLILGLAAALLYGWVLQPVHVTDTSLINLRQDYRTDYVLMVAEAYGGEGDLPLAVQRLAALGPETPAAYVDAALAYASDQAFAVDDIERISRLARDLQSAPPSPAASSP